MSTVLDEPSIQPSTSPSQRLRTSFAAVRIAFTWLGTRKTLTSDQKAQAAESFGAEGQYLSAGKKLLDTTHPAFKAVTGVRSRIVSLWKGMSLPYPEPGVRLIRQDQIEVFTTQLTQLKEELDEAVWRLDEHYAELKSAARERLGSLFDATDYPESVQGMFQANWDFPSVEPPDYLRQLNPEVYRLECERVSGRFDEAVQLAEAAFTEELHNLVAHLTERLAGQVDGRPKVFRDSAVENLTEFFERFRELNIRSNEQLDDLVGQCQQVVQGVEPQSLRDNQVLRTSVAGELSQVQSVLDDLLVDRPRRNILRRPRSPLNSQEVAMQLVIQPDGSVRCVYSETLDLHALGSLDISRGSHVEPDSNGQWFADLSPVAGPCLGPFPRRLTPLRRNKSG